MILDPDQDWQKIVNYKNDTLIVFLKEILEKVNFEKSHRKATDS